VSVGVDFQVTSCIDIKLYYLIKFEIDAIVTVVLPLCPDVYCNIGTTTGSLWL